jgi:hypothetical protein
MADVKCPMCGKPNPADAEVCEYCQARLKPLIISNLGNSDPADLLAGLRTPGETNPVEPETPEPAASEDDSTDWLARIRARHQVETPAVEGEVPTGGEEAISDWLTSLRRDAEEPAPTDDALSRLFGEAAPAAPESEPASPFPEYAPEKEEPSNEADLEIPPAGSDDDLGWLSAFTSEGTASLKTNPVEPTAEIPSEPTEAVAEPASDLGWLADFNNPEQPASEAKSGDDLDWLSAFQAVGSAGLETTLVESVAEPPAEPHEPVAEQAVDLVLGADRSEAQQPTSEGQPDDDLGWLNAFQFEQSAAPVVPGAESAIETPAEPVTDFDWLADLGVGGTPKESPAVLPGSALLDDESTEILQPAPDALPDWLVQLQGSPNTQAPAIPIQPAAPIQSEQPDWLVQFQGTPAAEPPAEPIQPSQPEQPDWLRSLSGETGETETPSGPFTVPVVAEPEISIPESSALVSPSQVIPDWLTSLPTDQPTNFPMAQAFLPEDQLAPSVPASTPALFGDQDLPEWIGQEESEQKPTEAEEPPTEELEPAQLPTWLQTMRPVEAVAPVASASDVDDNRVEKVGPLAGLRGLINGSETVTQYRKPPIYSIKLQVTERQRLHANLLENILNTETQATVPVKEARLSSQRILRGLVTLLLLAALLIPLVLQWQSLIPARNSSQMEVFIDRLSRISSGDPILLVVEYDPGLAAELEGAAAGPLKLLGEKNAAVTLISTNPFGPTLGEELLNHAPGWTPEKFSVSSANLGYIAGGSTAIAQLASIKLAGDVILNDLAKSSYRIPKDWQIQKNLSDYKTIILLTDNVETGRSWVEQISPALGETPLLIISSAQSAPILQSYTGAQVESLISGSTQVSNSRTAAFQIGMLLATLLILIGAVVQGVLLLVSRPKKPREE